MSDRNDTQNVRNSLSKRESWLLSALAEDRKTIFTLGDIRSKLNCSYETAFNIVHRIVRKKWAIQLTRGKYLIVPLAAGTKGTYTQHEFIIASHLAEPYYIAYWSALNHYGFTEQVPFTVFVATIKRAKSRRILDVDYRFVTLTKKKFFGFSKVSISNSMVYISNKEKTIADALDHPEYCGGVTEVAKCLFNATKDQISLQKLTSNAVKMSNSAILKRLGYLGELLGIEFPRQTMSHIRHSIAKGASLLDPSGMPEGNHYAKWNLILNVSEKSLLEWRRR